MPADEPVQLRPPEPLGRFQIGLSRLFRVQLGVAGLAAATAYVYHCPPDSLGHSVSPVSFIVAASLGSLVCYLLTRPVSSRITALVAAAMGGGTGAELSYLPPLKVPSGPFQPGVLALLGMCVAVSWYVTIGWVDKRR
jgi:hypothetical protein